MHLVVFRNKPCHFCETVTQIVLWAGSRWGHENEASFGAVRLGWGHSACNDCNGRPLAIARAPLMCLALGALFLALDLQSDMHAMQAD
jgi:hypothetical protein